MMMKEALLMTSHVVIILLAIILLVLPDSLFADSIYGKLTCGEQLVENSTIYVPNLRAAMENLKTQVQTSSFGTATSGMKPNSVYALAQCYGDHSSDECMSCYYNARAAMPKWFPMNGAMLYLGGCFMRTENYSFFQEYTGPNDRAICGDITQQDSRFQAATRQALSRAVSTAQKKKGYGRAQVAVAGGTNLSAYVLANCWRTISTANCRACLKNASASLLGCLPAPEGRVVNTGCFMRYSDIDFLNPIPISGTRNNSRSIVVPVIVVAAIVIVAGILGIGVSMWKNRTIQKRRKGEAEKFVNVLTDSSLNFKYSTLEKATASFDEANKLGQGGFGSVYKGVLPDGRDIAIKRLFCNKKHRAADFYNEANIISSLEHKNLVRLLGCSCAGPENLLVYEYLPNKSLENFIFDSSKGKELNWEKRSGTLGYMAPEYLTYGQLTEKADVYSFGVLLLEIVTGKQNNSRKNTEYTDSLVTIAWKHFQQGTVEELFDPNLMLDNYHNINLKNEILRVVHIGLLCIQEIPTLRPSMSKALLMLVKKEPLPQPTNPPFFYENTMVLNDKSGNALLPTDYGKAASVASISRSIFYPR